MFCADSKQPGTFQKERTDIRKDVRLDTRYPVLFVQTAFSIRSRYTRVLTTGKAEVKWGRTAVKRVKPLKWELDEGSLLRSREEGQRGVWVTRSKFKFKAAKVTALHENIKVRGRRRRLRVTLGRS